MNTSAKQLFLDTLEITKPSRLITDTAILQGNKILVKDKVFDVKGRPVYCIATGKASRPMASALKEQLGLSPSNMLCITPDTEALEPYCLSASHPIPDVNSKKAADKLIQFVKALPPQAIVFFLLSGGTSSLICKPGDGLTLNDLQAVNMLLLRSGASIREINSVRKHLSAIKGGQLLAHFPTECTLVDLIISDVPFDNLEDIGSGLTIPDSSTFRDARNTLLKYGLWNETPANARNLIEKGMTGYIPETRKPEKDPLEHHQSFIIGSARLFTEKMAIFARQKGFSPRVAPKAFDDTAKNVARYIAKEIKQFQKNAGSHGALIFYGESTIQVTGSGKGGRNQELALLGALEIDGMNNVTWLSADTDGIDGPTDAAGACVDGSTIDKANAKGLNPKQFIDNNDAHHFHKEMGTLLKTGPTGNNVMDVVVVLVSNGCESLSVCPSLR